jgi:peptide/nickel transport system ATP-binding protein
VGEQPVRLIEIRGLRVAFGGIEVVHGVDFSIAPGEAVGLVGESGSGKSVTWLAVTRLLGPGADIRGRVLLAGEDLLRASAARMEHIRGSRLAMIFQDPSSALNPVRRVGKQVAEAVRLHRGMDAASARAETIRLFHLVGLPDAAWRFSAYPHELSGGQNQRVMIAMALAGRPDLLIADEPTTALDATIQAQILDLLDHLRAEFNMALLLISHDLGVVSRVCDRIAVMYAGTIVEAAPADRLFQSAAHPYTRGLLGASPPLRGTRRRLIAISGRVPEPFDMPPGCPFAPRCPEADAACRQSRPILVPYAPGHVAACLHGPNQIAINEPT